MIIVVVFFLLAPYFNRSGVREAQFGGGARGDVCLHGRGLRSVSGYRTRETVNRGGGLMFFVQKLFKKKRTAN